MLETHCGYFATAKNPASNYFLTSSLILRGMSGMVLLRFRFTGGNYGLRGSLCTMMSMSSHGISWYDKENWYAYSRSNSTNLFFIPLFRKALTLTSFLSSSVPILINPPVPDEVELLCPSVLIVWLTLQEAHNHHHHLLLLG